MAFELLLMVAACFGGLDCADTCGELECARAALASACCRAGSTAHNGKENTSPYHLSLSGHDVRTTVADSS
jgi:hypothetical protein